MTRGVRSRSRLNPDTLATGATHAYNIPCIRCWRQHPLLQVHIRFGICAWCVSHPSS